ncbi:MAG: hypothetical protein LBF04_03875 [Prevotellaceae bacterium]|jgi:hypothetical protein|nr:hypothetical protein [Prevotellaceae bacterium]
MIVDNINTVKKHIAAITPDAISFAELEESIRATESWLRNNILGNLLYDFIVAKKEANSDLVLVSKAERIISLHAFCAAVPQLNLILTAAGFAVTNNEKVAPASKERVADLRAGLKKQCADAVEDLLVFLEKESDCKELWETSPSYTLFTDSFLPTYMLFKNYAQLSEAVASIFPKCRLDFATLRGKMRSVMAGKIAGAIGKKLTDELLDAMNVNNLSEAQKKLLEPLRFALAAYTLGLNDDGDTFINQALSVIKENPDDFANSGLSFATQEWLDKPIINLC